MGDTEQVMAEPDEVEVLDEGVDGLHPPTLNQQNPWFVTQIFNSVTSLIVSSGWYAVGFVIVAYLIWVKIQPRLFVWKRKREEALEAAAYHKDPDKFLARERAIDMARQRMQEKYSQSALVYAEKQKELEEKKRQEKIEDWERHERGEGYRNKTRYNAASSSSTSATLAPAKKSGKPRLKPEYNPMTGDGGGSCSWRPERRGAAGGG